jgi:hypothetical protein
VDETAWRDCTDPDALLEVSGLRLNHSVQLVQPYEAIIGSPCPTGVLLHRDWTVVRSIAAQIRDVLAAWETPRQLQVNTEALPHHLTSSRLVVVRGMAITGDGGLGLSAWREDLAGGERGRPTDVLVALRPGADPSEAEALPVRDCHAVTAIGRRPPDDAFFTGGLDGEMDAWSWEGRWVQHRLRGRTKRRQPRFPDLTDLTWATYNANSIVGICSLADGDRWASVSAGGEVCLWDGPTLTRSWQLPETGSPRSLAAHPDRPLRAVGIKQGGFARPESAVLLAEVEQVTLDPAWRTPAVLALAQAADRERIATGGALDPAHLAVLADALEEAGCTDGRALRHLRGHAPRLRGCWVVDQLLENE